jgi:hypothetical protein
MQLGWLLAYMQVPHEEAVYCFHSISAHRHGLISLRAFDLGCQSALW